MSESTTPAAPQFNPFSVLLTREELILIVKLMERDSLIGIEADPLGENLTPQLRAYGMVCAERSLRAREIAMFDETGTLRISNDVFSNVGVCVFAQQIFIVNHLSADRTSSDRVVLFSAGGEAVGMVSPSPALYKLVRLPNRPALFDELVTASLGRSPLETSAVFALSLPHAALASAREAGDRGDVAATQKALSTSTNSNEAAAALAQTLCQPHGLTVVHALVTQGKDQLQAQEFTIVRGDALAWLMFKTATHTETAEAAHASYAITAINSAELRGLMQTLFSTAI